MIVERMIATAAVHHNKNVKRVYYLSLEFLMGRLFSNSLYSAGVNPVTIPVTWSSSGRRQPETNR